MFGNLSVLEMEAVHTHTALALDTLARVEDLAVDPYLVALGQDMLNFRLEIRHVRLDNVTKGVYPVLTAFKRTLGTMRLEVVSDKLAMVGKVVAVHHALIESLDKSLVCFNVATHGISMCWTTENKAALYTASPRTGHGAGFRTPFP